MDSNSIQVMFSSASVEWATPQKLFDELNKEFNFTLDAAATEENTKCLEFFTKEENSLAQDWGKHTVFLNPPYTRRENKLWLQKAHDSSMNGATVVLLLPSRTGSGWFHDTVLANNHEVRFLRGRQKFGGCKNSAPFDSIVVIMRPSAGS